MPIYEYRCDDCGQEFEYLVLSSSEIPECPSCQKQNVSKLMSASTFFSKGGGGLTESSSAGASSCGGCAATNCGSCTP